MIEKHVGKLSQGCELCFKGKKLVLFVTGICPRKCIYCPLSEKKKNKDVIYANEVKVLKISDLLKETELSNAEGAGITGGDPLSKLNRTINYIKQLKKKFTKRFHIHLYTSLNLINKNSVYKLQKAGLDELRIHIDINENKENWKKLSLIKNKFKEVGIEIPVIPGEAKKIIEMINYCKDFVDFFNLNELEYATLYEKEYKKRKWKVNEKYEIKKSEETALNILKYFNNKKIRIHYCSAEFKDKIQFCERIKVRAKKVSKPFDLITNEGMFLRGAVYLEETKPGFESKKRLITKKQLVELKNLKKHINKRFCNIPLELDLNNGRILCSFKNIKKISKKFKNSAIVEEYPTQDQLEVYIEFLS